ncbi:N-acetyl-alpha-D-glucosaminyl L-malate synthase [Tepidimonas thermarum]|uniref:N-acetyl-alpha-D-glucosaminyl L-malate synthase n=1 Tax=Tepidimonas thermarum TaxID=335431 RepID=A0A554WWM6_9BURK|nr:glycosyltransferase family 4 protein [Tepidimonas thermarum]TSE27976.1 N-acetyl-alpha-D-glucosaminyl L-malate synthase [Tepidimonas thermarum]
MTTSPQNNLGVWFPAVRAHSGADVFTQRLCAALNARGIRAEIAWLPLRAEYAPWSVPAPMPPQWATIVHVNSWLHPRFLPRGLPVVSTLHSCVHDPALAPYKRPAQRLYHATWIKRVEAANLRRAQAVVAVSHYTAQVAQAAFGRRDIQVIHNGVDIDQFHPIDRNAPNQPFRLLYVGNWVQRKGVDLLAPILHALGPSFELHYSADRSGAHTRFALPTNARCLGRLDTAGLVAAYQQADALLFPSRLEGLPLTVLEAMACGLPVIATKTSSLPEVVEHGVSGWLCPVDDVAAFADAARQLAQNPAQWLGMRRAARGRAERLFNASRLLSQWLDVYCSLFAHDAR